MELDKLNNTIDRANLAIANSDFQQAIDLLESLTYLNNVDILSNLGACYSKVGNQDKALYYLEMALRIEPNDAHALSNKANALFRRGNFEDASVIYERVISSNPKNKAEILDNLSIIYNDIGVAYSAKFDYSTAVRFFIKSTEANINFHTAWSNLGKSYSKLGDYEKAKSALNKSIQIKETAESYLEIGNIWAAVKDYPKSIVAFKKSIDLNPDYVSAHFNLGNSYFDQKEYKLAFDCYLNAVKLNPRHSGSLNCLGILFTKKGKYEKALELFEKAVLYDPQNLTFQKNVKTCKEKLGLS